MKKIVWSTDLHLDFPSLNIIETYFKKVEAENPDFILISGDIANSTNIVKYLKRFSEINCNTLFVLGNHDFYGSSIKKVNEKVRKLSNETKNLFYLDEEDPIKISSSCCVIGNGCWADGRSGNWEKTNVRMNDDIYIEEFSFHTKEYKLITMQYLADLSAKQILRNLELAFKQYQHVYLVTHVSPWREASVYEDKISDDNFAPYFVCQIVGETIENFMKNCNGKLTVLCGHSHGESKINISDNICVFTGKAEYYSPGINKIFEEE